MKIRNFWAALALLALGTMSAAAQVGRIEGDVKKQGTGEPIPGAKVQIVREDIKGNYDVTADKKGHFLHAGVPYVGRYTLLVSAPEFAPYYASGIRPTGELIAIELAPGDGKVLTYDEVKKAAPAAAAGAAAAGGQAAKQPSQAEVKKQAEEYEKAKAAQEKQKADFEKMKTKFQEGVQLSQNKDYNGAITAFKEASAADPEQQAIWANLALALYNRGATQLNAGQRDPAKQDFVDSVGAADKALALVEPQLSDAAKGPEAKKSKAQYLKIKADANAVLAKRFSDAAAADAAFKDYQEAGNLTDDPGVKKTYTLKGAETLFDAGKSQEAITAYEAILQADPENIEATYKLGLAYSGVEKYQEAANFLRRFADKAPGTDPRVAEAKAVIDHLKVGNNITPQKVDTKGSRGAPRKKP
jgi:tetratricopeptide (TPR) repeat protein